jgi:hypothetical protein
MTDDATTAAHAEIDVEIQDLRAQLSAAVPGSGQSQPLQERLEALYRRRYAEPGAAGTSTPSLDTLDAAIRATPATAEHQADREALYRARYGPGEEDQEPVAPVTPVRVDWGAGNVSESDRLLRGEIETHFGAMGLTDQEANHVIARAQAYAMATLTDDQYETRKLAAERTLRAEGWDDRRLSAAYHLYDAFLKKYGQHEDVRRADDNGLGHDVPFLKTLDAVSKRRGIPQDQGAIASLRAALAKAERGSKRFTELSQQLTETYRRLHGGA